MTRWSTFSCGWKHCRCLGGVGCYCQELDSKQGFNGRNPVPLNPPVFAEPEIGATLKLTELYSLLNLLWTLHVKFGNISDCQRFLIRYKKLQSNTAAQIWQPREGFLINFKRSAWILGMAGCIKHSPPSLEWEKQLELLQLHFTNVFRKREFLVLKFKFTNDLILKQNKVLPKSRATVSMEPICCPFRVQYTESFVLNRRYLPCIDDTCKRRSSWERLWMMTLELSDLKT